MSSTFMFLLFIAGAICAPFGTGGGFNLGGSSNSSFHIGTEVKAEVKDKVLKADGGTSFGGLWNGNGYGGVHGHINDQKFGAGGDLGATLGNKIDTTHTLVAGLDPANKSFVLKGSSDLDKKSTSRLTGDGGFGTGSESRGFIEAKSADEMSDIVHGGSKWNNW